MSGLLLEQAVKLSQRIMHEADTLHCEGGKAFVLPSLVYHLASVFPAMVRLTGRNSESGHIVLKSSLNLWIL